MSDTLRINKAYAENYNKWRQKEELQKLKDKYGDVENSETDSSSSESEDENAEALSSQIERDWLKTLSALKSKDPKIYNKDFQFYHEAEEAGPSSGTKKTDKQTPLFLKDYERKVILEKEGHLSDEDDTDDESDDDEKEKLGYYEQQEEIKKSIKEALSDSDDSSDTELFIRRTKSKPEQQKEDEDYLEWLKGQGSNLRKGKQAGIELEPLKEYWNDPKLDEGEKFLRDYILNKGYLDQDSDRIPTYDEIVDDGEGLSDDENILEKQEEFERKYNFRFEEPDQDFIKTFPRQIEDSVRTKVSKRAEKRKEIKERKKREKEKKKEEIKQLKNLKKKEILSKIDQLKEITGNPSLGFSEGDLEEDFDPKKHDEMMKKYFDEEYYGMDAEDQKPEVPDDFDDLKDENWDEWGGQDNEGNDDYADEGDHYEPHVDDPDFVMDDDYDPSQEKSKKKGKKSKFAQAVRKSKPVFDPNQKTFEQYFDEYYKLDYEDIVGDTPCRFKYRKVVPNNFGLETGEILKCRDKELNAWVSLKKMSQFRTEEEEKIDVKIYDKKGKNERKKLNVLTTLREETEKKKKSKVKSTEGQNDTGDFESQIQSQKKKKSNVAIQQKQAADGSGVSAKRKNTEDFEKHSPKKLKVESDPVPQKDSKKEKVNSSKGDKKAQSDSATHVTSTTAWEVSVVKETVGGKRKRKNKRKSQSESGTDHKGPNSAPNENDTCESVDDSTKTAVSVSQSLVKSSKTDDAASKKKRKKKKKKKGLPKLSDERLLAYGINPKKLKYMKTDNYKGENKASG